MSAGLGPGRLALGCGGCARQSGIGGLVFTAAVGATFPGNTGVALVAHRFTEVSFEYSQRSHYLLVLGQYDPGKAPLTRRVLPGMRGFAINAGLGHGRHWGDESSPYEDRVSGPVGTIGVALRVPAGSLAALSVSASHVAAFTTRPDERVSAPTGARIRPRITLVTASLSLAARSASSAPGTGSACEPHC